MAKSSSNVTVDLTEDLHKVWMSLPAIVRKDSALNRFKDEYIRQNVLTHDQDDSETDQTVESDLEKIEFTQKTIEKRKISRQISETIKKQWIFAKIIEYDYKKLILLGLIWIMSIVALMGHDEKIINYQQLALKNGSFKYLEIPKLITQTDLQLLIKGSFDVNQNANNESINHLHFSLMNDDQVYDVWSVPLSLSFTHSATSLKRRFSQIHYLNVSTWTIRIEYERNIDKSDEAIGIELAYDNDPLNESIGVICAAAILIGLYILIIFEIVHRTFGAIVASVAGISVLAFMNDRPTMTEVVIWMDMESLLLLFSMMVLVGILTETGVFDVIAVWTFKVTKGKLWPLIYCLCMVSAILSALLDNVTVILLMAPLTIRLCQVTNLNPKPVLMAVVIYTNIGGTMTPVGGPPNIMITSNAHVASQGLSFITFSLHMSVGAILLMIQSAIHFRIIYRNAQVLRLKDSIEVLKFHREIDAWKLGARNLTFYPDAVAMRNVLMSKIQIMEKELKKMESSGSISRDEYELTLKELERTYTIKNHVLLVQSGCIFGLVILLFLIQSIPSLKSLSLGWCALLGVILLLIISGKDDMDIILQRVEWATLLFFATMFITMECLARLGLVNWIGQQTEFLILCVEENARLALGIAIILWVSAITSSFVDAIPVTAMMLKVVIILAENPNLQLPLQPLIWALAYGPSIGGNGTLYGASANTVCAGVASQQGYKIKFFEYMKVCYPIMLGNIFVLMVYLIVAHVVFQWN